jgi:hypothetical protein
MHDITVHDRSGSCPSQLLQNLPPSVSAVAPSEYTPLPMFRCSPMVNSVPSGPAVATNPGLLCSSSQLLKPKECTNIVTTNPVALLSRSVHLSTHIPSPVKSYYAYNMLHFKLLLQLLCLFIF